MGPEKHLPFDDAFPSADAYVDSLLDFVGTHDLLRVLCGGVHILDFFTTTDPDLYSRVLPQEWRDFFARHEIMDILDLLMRDDIEAIDVDEDDRWRDGLQPPRSLLEYIRKIRKHLLLRDAKGSQCARNRAMKPTQKLARQVAVGMNIKKVHEVGLFARYVSDLTDDISSSTGRKTTHLVDFGSGQNYLGRALASEPYNKRIVAIESKSHNAERAKEFDVMARLTAKELIMRNKKVFRAGLELNAPASLPTPPQELATDGSEPEPTHATDSSLDPAIEAHEEAKGSVQYVEHRIMDGDLSGVVQRIPGPNPQLMVISPFSCGNLVHHGLRSLVLNPSVKAVAMVGCCYNLLTERLGPATYKLPSLRPTAHEHPRLTSTGEANDPHGFPMSDRLCKYGSQGIRLNITARMMAVQAPQNWGEKDSEEFFTRHFYRALLQRIFLDRGLIGTPSGDHGGVSPAGHSSGTPIIIGKLRKSCYTSFVAYVQGALAKLYDTPETGVRFRQKTEGLTDEEIEGYAVTFGPRKKDLSVIWSLMAFSAGVVEATIVVDRWLWLREQEEVSEAWVEPVFEYRMSPRNLVVVGIKK
ncbi:hypothetical protein LTR91_008835 [Friedmanniomyces endolithicus]|uniref:Methyltransferase domain-containing protein n=1 Tax=Friedmanniomyces endolithicus TaxID=329885 RepID=A0AAN6KMN0_9PEZI|nr:hypothetical protein LTR57_000234 [Friedmanniomyces endolithicus]KAK0990893.1 hypothetical protein LTR91_008835 [Friedmanniomyces endolithicus]KAK1010075.1 hypothetical protein LTS01_001747 [Friedmanniomyces endolithicus]KAK1043840.1 hypothetical protein LTS16_007682 [Friedmanniomyces endolithicus]